MIPTLLDRPPAAAGVAVGCTIAGYGSAEAAAADLPALRQQLAPAWAGSLSTPLFRQADDQTILGLAALTAALADMEASPDGFGDWGILASPRYFGRAALAASLERSRVDGPWGVSPHFVAHRSLHSLPGMLSLALKARGPNLGVGGGPGGEAQALLTAATVLRAERPPGVWVVFTGYAPEPVPTPQGQVPPESVCRALALALTADDPASARAGFRLRFVCRPPACDGPAWWADRFTMESLRAVLGAGADSPATWVWRTDQGLIELYWPGAGQGKHG